MGCRIKVLIWCVCFGLFASSQCVMAEVKFVIKYEGEVLTNDKSKELLKVQSYVMTTEDTDFRLLTNKDQGVMLHTLNDKILSGLIASELDEYQYPFRFYVAVITKDKMDVVVSKRHLSNNKKGIKEDKKCAKKQRINFWPRSEDNESYLLPITLRTIDKWAEAYQLNCNDGCLVVNANFFKFIRNTGPEATIRTYPCGELTGVSISNHEFQWPPIKDSSIPINQISKEIKWSNVKSKPLAVSHEDYNQPGNLFHEQIDAKKSFPSSVLGFKDDNSVSIIETPDNVLILNELQNAVAGSLLINKSKKIPDKEVGTSPDDYDFSRIIVVVLEGQPYFIVLGWQGTPDKHERDVSKKNLPEHFKQECANLKGKTWQNCIDTLKSLNGIDIPTLQTIIMNIFADEHSAVTAINLDGGGSASMIFNNKNLVKSQDKEDGNRPVINILGFKSKRN